MADSKPIAISWKAALIGLGLVIVGGFILWAKGKKAGVTVPIPLPDNGSGIPAGWSPTADVIRLRNAFNGFGTDEEGIFNTLTGKTNDQLIAIRNEYAHRYSEDLIERFNDELSGDDLTRALQFYQGLV